MKRQYGKDKSEAMPGGRISKKFKKDLKEWSEKLQCSQAQLLENGFYHFITSEQCFHRCPKCDAPSMTMYHIPVTDLSNVKCPTCGHIFDIKE